MKTKAFLFVAGVMMAALAGYVVDHVVVKVRSAPEQSLVAVAKSPSAKANPPGMDLASAIHKLPADAPTWAIPYGKEFWRESRNATVAIGNARGPSGLNVADVIHRVSHAIRQEAGTAYPQSRARSFTARFDGEGFRLAPEASVAKPAEALFRTTGVRWGADEIYSREKCPPWSIVGNTAQALLTEGLIEHYECREAGVEVTWVVNERSSVAGPIQIEAQLTGYDYTGADKLGHYFAAADGSPGIRVGAVTLVDAKGVRQELPLAVEGSALRVQVPESLLEQATFPIAIDPVVGPVTLQPDLQFQPDVASNGDNYLVVWSDGRNERNDPQATEDIYGARVSLTGDVLDVGGIAICRARWAQFDPAVASNGDDYMVVWADTRDADTIHGTDIYGAVVTGGGALAGEFPVCTVDHRQTAPGIASDGNGYFALWSDDRIHGSGSSDIYGARLSSGGAVLQEIEISTQPENDYKYNVRIAGAPSGYLATWTEYDLGFGRIRLFGMRIGLNGTGKFLIREDAGVGSVAYSAPHNKFLVTYDELVNEGIYGRFIPVTGPISGNPFEIIHIPRFPPGLYLPELACNGETFAVTWLQSTTDAQPAIYAKRVRASDGAVLDANPILVSTLSSQDHVKVASGGNNFLIVWQVGELDDTDQAPIDIYAALLTAAGQVVDIFPVSISGVGANAVHRLNEEFSTSANPSPESPWSYGYAEQLDGSFTPVTFPFSSPADDGTLVPSWQLAWGRSPAFYFNDSGHAITVGGGAVTCQPGDVWFVPGDDGYPENYGVIRYTVPASEAGIHQILARVQSFYVDWIWTGDTDFHILHNGVEIYGNFLPGGGSAGFTRTLNLAANDTIDFVIGRGADESQYASVLKIWATLQRVAAPGNPNAASSPNNDFSLDSNPLPGGRWTLGHSESIGSAFTAVTFADPNSAADDGTLVPCWQPDLWRSPAFYCNTSDHTITAGGGAATFVPRTLWVAAGDDGYPENYGVLRYTVPAGESGLHTIGAVVEAVYLTFNIGDTDFHLLKNGQEIDGQEVPAGGWGMFGRTLQLSQGDTIELAVGRGADGIQYASCLKIWAAITRLP